MLLTFIQTLGLIALMELGDKTQFLAIAMTRKYKLRDILIGITVSILLLNLIAVCAGSIISDYIPLSYISLAAGALFLLFAVMSIFDKDDEEEECKTKNGVKLAFISVAGAFFLAELGDKTQIAAMSVAATKPGYEVAVFLGASAGLLIADIAGILVGLLLGKAMPQNIMKWITIGIFTFFGLATLREPLAEFTGAAVSLVILAALFIIILGLSVFSLIRAKNNAVNK